MTTAHLGTLLRHIQKLGAGRRAQEPTDRQLLDDFAGRRDEHAFTTLVARHGPMVLRVCRRVLGHEQDAEDAFQATFLILARNLTSIRKHEALADWLHGVAYRTAMKVKRTAARRRTYEARVRASTPEAVLSPRWDDVQAVLDEEIRGLPEPFRAAFTLCVLESKSGPEAAVELGCKEGTVSSRLTRARQRLRQQLLRRGIQLSALLAAQSVAESASRAALPPVLARSTVRFGLLVAAGEPAAEVIPSHVAALAAGVTRAMFLTRSKIALIALLAAGLIAGGGMLAHQVLAAPQDKPKAEAKAPADAKPPAADAKPSSLDVRGRVLDPDGKPVKGARLIFVYGSARKVPEKVWATSAADGRFEFAVSNEVLTDRWYESNKDNCYVVAAADGFGAAAAKLPSGIAGEVTLQLVEDDVPLQGRILDLQGKPVAGATVRINDALYVPRKGDLTAWLEELKAAKENSGRVNANHLLGLWSPAYVALIPPVPTGADGRFTIKGIGRERVVSLRIEGPTIVTRQVQAMTRRGDMIHIPDQSDRPESPVYTYLGTGFDLVIPPTKPVVGVVRDKDTGKPLAGVTVNTYLTSGAPGFDENLARVTTDQEGRYRLVGLPKGPGSQIVARSDDLPYMRATQPVPDTPGLEPVTVDFDLQRGVWVTGRVTDKATGQPVAAGVEYYCLAGNPSLNKVRLNGPNWFGTKDDGSYRALALPGPGVITVRSTHDRYRMGVGADAIKGPRDPNVDLILAQPHLITPGNYHTLVAIDPAPDALSVTCDVVLDPGRTLKGMVVGPDGQPLTGCQVSGQKAMNYWEREPLKGAEFTMLSLGDDEARLIQVMHEGKKLAGSVVVHGKDQEPVRIQLQPWGSVTGRLVTFTGEEPLTSGEVAAYGSAKKEDAGQVGFLPGKIRPGKDGKFRLDGLVPGLKYNLSVVKGYYGLETDGPSLKGITIKPGETRDLGDIRVKLMQ